ncbi:hypothetical protein RI528_21760 [Aeromonas veronii]|uniref:hypothetical protein n=1 Tax=Aeromonas veronii TaxID=654 RepID=UPI00343D7A65
MTRQIFDLSEYYKEATNEDITESATNDTGAQVSSTSELIEISDNWIRRKISLLQQKSDILNLVPINEMKAIAAEFNILFNSRCKWERSN